VNESEFEAQLKADGFQEIEKQTLAPRPGRGRHRHHFAIRGLVLSGTFFVTQTADPVTYGPGQVFAVDDGELHDESVGPDGARPGWAEVQKCTGIRCLIEARLKAKK
jgi:quercetin dioxygenase-like cupin family protein